ncbi:MAG: FAD-dependent monooxygenase [Clostridia bacterium]|nr:FAD-dependent monooxygenase [Clostridia bacterium]
MVEILPVEKNEIKEIKILREELSVDTGAGIGYKLTVGAAFSPDREAGLLKMKKKVSPCPDYTLDIPTARKKAAPVIVGSGPAGLFAAMVLCEAGCTPTVIERGLDVDARIKKVNEFMLTGRLDSECNIQFGEGGAGTYSDGKLKVGSMDAYKHYILTSFVEAGATEDILYSTSAHLGTDKLSGIVKRLREKMISMGATFIYGARMTDFKTKEGRVCAVEYEKDGKRYTLDTDTLILAAGHSARDVFELLSAKGVPMQAKGFGIGVRVEHPREYINSLVYGKDYPDSLGSASYHLVSHLPNGRSVYSFCMCPGGSVVAATSSPCGVVTNGMSEYGRDADNSNAAILVSVTPEDFGSDSPLAGIEYQKRIEEGVFGLFGEYRAPAARLCEVYSDSRTVGSGSVRPSYQRGVEHALPGEYLPDFIADSLKAGFTEFDKWMPGYAFGDAVLTGAETRSTSPVRVLRGDDLAAIGTAGLYPIGEGAGYAGGIVSSARDGVACAISLIKARFS